MGKNKIGVLLKLGYILILGTLTGASLFGSPARAGSVNPDSAFDPARLTEDEKFIAKDFMSVSSIQNFLNSTPFGNRSCLANYSEGGRSAAQIIYDYTRGTQDPPAVGSFPFNPRDISLHPGVVLVTLQKEMGLISAPDAACPSDRLRVAMGYGCPDGGGCDPSYYGFANQILYGAWQLDRNFDCADGSDSACSPYFSGATLTFTNSTDFYNVSSSQSVTLGNKATAALYRYTPHAFNGNYNFWKYFRDWFPSYVSQWHHQSAVTVTGESYYPTVTQGQSIRFKVLLKNTGTATWQRGTVNLGTDRGRDRIPSFIREDRVSGNPSGWLKENRILMKDAAVAPGGVATFEFFYTVPDTMSPGVYREYFRPVVDGIQWLEDWGIYWDVTVLSLADSYRAEYVSQNAHPVLRRNQSIGLEVRLKNTGVSTWRRGVVNLGTDRGRDRTPGFIREDRVSGNPSGWLKENRVRLVEDSVAPGQVGTFRLWYTVPGDKEFGTYREYFRPVADDFSWMDDWGIYWDVTVIP